MDIESHNHRQIEQLNQRGGRSLSIVDLVRTNTMSVQMAACAMRAMADGASLLTGARPGGAGKSTLLGALLGLLPPDVPLITVDSPQIIEEGFGRPASEPACYLVHEIGSGHWYGYLWGKHVADYLSLIDGQRRIASCLHADTLEELTDILSSPPLSVAHETLGRLGLILFIHVVSGRTRNRRVVSFWESDGCGGHCPVFRWNKEHDEFAPEVALHDPETLVRYQAFIQRLVAEGDTEMDVVRRKVLAFYGGGATAERVPGLGV